MISTQRPKAVIYCRVSTRSQEDEGHGLQSQETRCREYAISKGYEISAVFPDTISGGGDFMKRPGMVALLSFLDAQPGQSFVVIFDDLKRFARDTRFHLDLREAFRLRNAKIECLNFKFEETPEGEFIETIMAAQGALERKQNGRQVAQKMKARMQSGYWVHNAPYGYRYQTIKGRGKVLVPDEPLASVIREAYEGFASGRFQSQAEVKRFFEGSPHFPRNKHGDVKQYRVTEIFSQPLYAGYICSETYKLDWLKGQHEPLVSLKTWDKVQERRQGATKAPARKNIGDDFALRGFVTCGGCGVPLRSSWSKGKTKRHPYYLCQTKACEHYGKSIRRDQLEGDFAQIVKTMEPAPSLIGMATHMFRKAWAIRTEQAQGAKDTIKREISETEDQIETLLSRIISASSDSIIGAYEKKIAELEKVKGRLLDSLSYQSPARGKFDEVLELSLNLLSTPWKIWESGDPVLRRTLLRLAFSERLAYHRNSGARTPNFTLPFKALSLFQNGESVSGGVGET